MQSPKAPQWDLPVNIPLVDSTFTLQELVKNTDDIRVLENGLVGLHYEGEFDTTKVGDQLTLPDVAHSYEVAFNTLEIPEIAAAFGQYYFFQLSSDAVTKDGQTSTVDAFTFNNVEGLSFSSSELVATKIREGSARLVINNQLPVPLQNVTFTLKDQTTGDVILETLVADIAASATTNHEFDVSGKTISSNTVWIISGKSPGSGDASVVISKNAPLNVLMKLFNIKVDEIDARLPAIDINETDNLKLDVGAGIKEAAFQSGQASLKVVNTTPIPARLSFTLNELLDKRTNLPISFTIDLDAKGTSTTNYDLSEYVAKMKIAAPGEVQTTPITVTGKTFETTDGPVKVQAGNGFKIDFSMKNIVLDYIEGWLAEHQVDLTTTESTINLPEKFGGLEGIKIGDGRLMITIFNTMGLPIRFEGSIEGTSESGKTATFLLNESINPGQNGKEVATIIPPFTPENSNILQFINLPPKRVLADGKAWVGDGTTIGRVSRDDYVRAKYVLESAFKASWESRTINADTTELSVLPPDFTGVKDDNITTLNSDVTKDLQKLELHAQIENHLPIGVGIRFHFATDLKNLDKNPDLVLGPIDLPPAPADANGVVTQAVSKESVLSIGENDVRLFQNTSDVPKPLFIATEVLIYSTNGKEVQVFATDYVKVRAFTRIVNRIGNE
ncbi:MAG: hypothetical protein GWP06_10930 [Actinobacteria bacterium]|nr:hypothetical protein [Actinomycetota bacterium]